MGRAPRSFSQFAILLRMKMLRFRGIWHRTRPVAAAVVKTPFDLLYAYRARDVERLLLTIGYNRSGSSLLGQLLTAHPEVVVSHDLYLLEKLHDLRFVPTPSLKGRATRLVLEQDREFHRKGRVGESDYPYAVNGLWQGKHARLRAIGDKGSVNVTRWLGERRMRQLEVLRRVRLPVRFLFTIRNPYDMVASRRIHRCGEYAAARTPALRDYTPTDAERVAVCEEDLGWFLRVSENLSKILSAVPKADVLPMRHEEFIASPREKLCEICTFVGVGRNREHLDACADFTFPTPHRTRRKVRWSEDQVNQIAAAIAKFPWLAGYDFHA